MLELAYAKEFHIPPDQVRKTVTVEWWRRWLLGNKAEASREIWSLWMNGNDAQLTPGQQELRNWAMLEDY